MFSDPVVGDHFFGRQDIIDLLVKRADALKAGYRQNIAIIGHQQLGKTSILRHFLHVYRHPDILAVYVEIKLQALDYFVDQFIRSLLFQYLSQAGQSGEPTESLKQLSDRARSMIPQTISKIEEIGALLRQRHAEEAYSRLFELTSVIRQETGKHCIVILDEFHRLGDFGIKNAFSDFGKRIMVQKDTMYLLSSSSFSASRKILAEKLALLFGNFERIYLEHFDFETCIDFIRKRLAPVHVPDSLLHFLIAFTDGHPFFLETMTSRVKELALASGEPELCVKTVSEALLKLLFESQGVLNQYFMKLISPWTQSSSQGSHVLVLTELARGRNRLKDIALAINRSQTEVQRNLREMMERELIVKTGVFYRFHNRIFPFWLREVYEKKELSLLGASGKAEDFMKTVGMSIAEYEEWIRMNAFDRIVSLFREFRNDLVEFGEKKRKLPHFTEFISSKETGLFTDNQSVRDLIAKGHGRCWICRITEEKATEKEILQFIRGSDRSRHPHTKVFLALQGMDSTAKLVAKEKRVFTMSLSRVNMLMDLYGKSPIIRTQSNAEPPAEVAR